jgi:hypothetical protein
VEAPLDAISEEALNKRVSKRSSKILHQEVRQVNSPADVKGKEN